MAENNTKENEKKHSDKDEHISTVQKRVIGIVGVAIFVILCLVIGWVLGRSLFSYADDPEQFREWISGYGVWGWLICCGMMVLQIVIAFIPGSLVEIGAGYAFGIVQGTIICVVGSIIGCAIVFQLVRVFGAKVIEAFYPVEKIHALRFLQDERRRDVFSFIIFLIPGMPKDLLSYFMGLTGMSLMRWLVLSTLARTPAIVVSAMAGTSLSSRRYIVAVIVLVVILAISIVGGIFYNRLTKKQNNPDGENEKVEDKQTDNK